MVTQNQVQNNIKIKKIKKVFRKDNDELIVKDYLKKEPAIIQHTIFKVPPKNPSCRGKIWIELDNVWHCRICEYIINKQKHRVD